MRVFVVWEPILQSDFMVPTTGVLRRIPDTRARHYGDEDRIVASAMKRDARPPQPKGNCCERDGVLWDLVAIYPKGARWEATMPPAMVFDGPVVRVTEKMHGALAKQAAP